MVVSARVGSNGMHTKEAHSGRLAHGPASLVNQLLLTIGPRAALLMKLK